MKTVAYKAYLVHWLNIWSSYSEEFPTQRVEKSEIVARCYARAARRFYPKGLLKDGVSIMITIKWIKDSP